MALLNNYDGHVIRFNASSSSKHNCSIPDDLQRWSPLAEQVKAVLRDFPELKLTEGRKVLEIRPSIMWDKGRAVEFLLKSLGECRIFIVVVTATVNS